MIVNAAEKRVVLRMILNKQNQGRFIRSVGQTVVVGALSQPQRAASV
jgi:hypothetical protein